MTGEQHLQIINRLGKHYPQINLLADEIDDSGVMRVFELNEGEELTLARFGPYDYLYALKGEAKLLVDDGSNTILEIGCAEKLRYQIPANTHRIRITALGRVLVCQVDGEELDYLIALNEILDPADDEARKRAHLIRNSRAFHRLPIEVISEALHRLQRVEVSKGEDVVTQGEPGDAYYIIEEGSADVWEVGIYDDEPKRVNELSAGDAFGEEALVMEGSRSATVRMTTDGVLLRLDKVDFDQLLKKRMVQWVDAGTAKSLIERGYELLDVRYEEEYEESYIPGAVHLPLQEIRQRYRELDPKKPYVIYCKGGKRSAVACMLLGQHAYEAVSLTGGINDWPYECVKNY